MKLHPAISYIDLFVIDVNILISCRSIYFLIIYLITFLKITIQFKEVQ